MTHDPRPHGPGNEPESGPSAATYAGLGLQLAAAIVIFAFAGNWLDRRLGTSPLFILLGVFLGAGGAFYGMYRKLMASHRGNDHR